MQQAEIIIAGKKILLIGDSMLKRLFYEYTNNNTENIHRFPNLLLTRSGALVEQITKYIDTRCKRLDDYEYTVLLIGTNNLKICGEMNQTIDSDAYKHVRINYDM